MPLSLEAQTGPTTTAPTQTSVQRGNPIQLTVQLPSQRDFVVQPINKAACGDADQPMQIAYNATQVGSAVTANARFRIFLNTSTECINATPSAYLFDEPFLSLAAYPTGSFPTTQDITVLSLNKVVNVTTACATETDSAVAAVCFIIDNQGAVGGLPAKYQGFLQVNIDTKPPPAPTDLTAQEGDSSVVLSWTAPSDDINTYTVTTRDDTGEIIRTDSFSLTTTGRVENLANGRNYSFVVRALDAAGNEGPDSAAVNGSPRDECNFWKCYEGKERGGFCFITTAAYGSYDADAVKVFRGFRDLVLAKTEIGRELILFYYRHGAKPAIWLAQHESARQLAADLLVVPRIAVEFALDSSLADVGLAALAVLLLLVLAYRRDRRPVPGALLGLMLLGQLVPVTSYAQSNSAFSDEFERFDEPTESERDKSERPRLGFSLKMGTYRPNIDSDPAANNIYQTFFGPSDQYMLGAGRKLQGMFEGDFYILRSVGLLGVSGSVGYWQAAGRTRVCRDATTAAAIACTSATLGGAELTKDSVQFSMIPLSISVLYKFDYLREEFDIPIVPYVRAGLDLVLWRVDSGGKEAKKRNGASGTGSTMGWHVRPGVAIGLDWLEPDTARRAFHSAGIHGTYLTFEWTINELSDFRAARSWDLSDSSFLAGVSIDLAL